MSAHPAECRASHRARLGASHVRQRCACLIVVWWLFPTLSTQPGVQAFMSGTLVISVQATPVKLVSREERILSGVSKVGRLICCLVGSRSCAGSAAGKAGVLDKGLR